MASLAPREPYLRARSLDQTNLEFHFATWCLNVFTIIYCALPILPSISGSVDEYVVITYLGVLTFRRSLSDSSLP